ncbi:conserved repeat domain protein, partial [Clostridium botulinum C str. Eklund]
MALESRYNNVINGNITFIGNTLGLSKAPDSQNMGTADAIGAFITTNTGLIVPSYPAGTTLNISENSSSAVLNLGSGSEVQFAYLIWGGTYKVPGIEIPDNGTNKIKFTVPNNPTPYNISADRTNFINPFLTVGLYSHMANVTKYVAPAGSGTYTVSQVAGTTSPSNNVYNCCGWTLAVIYKNPELYDSRYINFYYGIHYINSSNTYEVNFTDFETKPSPRLNTSRFLVSAMQASADVKGDQVLFGPDSSSLTPLSGPNNPADNFFGSQINGSNGNIDKSGTFGDRNHNVLTATNISGGRQGWDITNIDVDSTVTNSQTQANLKFQSSNDNYYPNAFALVTTIKSPSIVILINVSKYMVGSIGDTFKITMRISNSGEANANYILIKAALPYGLTGVIGSVTVDGVNQGHIGIDTGFALMGLNVGDAIVVEGLVQVYDKPTKNSNQYVIYGDIYYKFARPTGGDYTGDKYSRSITLYSAPVDISKTSTKKIVNPDRDTVEYTIDVINTSNVNVDNVVITDVLPNGLSFANDSVSVDGSNSSSNIVTTGVSLGTMTPGETHKILFTADVNSTPTSGTEYENFAKVAYQATFGSVPYNNEYTSTGYSIYTNAIIITPTINKTANKKIVTPGTDTVEYTISITNDGSNINTNSMTNMVLTDPLPNGLSYKAGTLTIDGNSSNDSPTTGINIPNQLIHGGTIVIKFTANVNTEPPTGFEYVNHSTLTYKFNSPVGQQSNTANSNSNTIYSSSIVIKPTLNLTSNVSSVILGDTIEYTATVTNTNATEIENAIFNNKLPNGLSFIPNTLTINDTPNSATSLESNISLGNITNRNPVVVKYSVSVDSIPNDGSIYPNSFTLNYDFQSIAGKLNYTLTSNINTVTINIPIRATVVLSADKTYVTSIGDTIEYTATISNPSTNTNPIYNIVLSSSLPSALSFKPGSITINDAPSNDSIANVSVGTIDHSNNTVVKFTAIVNAEPTIGNSYTNSVNVKYKFQNALGENTGNINSNPVKVYSPSIIIYPTLNLKANKYFVVLGDTITFTATVSNDTSILINTATFSTKLPKGLSFVSNSLTINDDLYPDSAFNNPIELDAIPTSTSIIIKYSVKVTSASSNCGIYPNFFTIN